MRRYPKMKQRITYQRHLLSRSTTFSIRFLFLLLTSGLGGLIGGTIPLRSATSLPTYHVESSPLCEKDVCTTLVGLPDFTITFACRDAVELPTGCDMGPDGTTCTTYACQQRKE